MKHITSQSRLRGGFVAKLVGFVALLVLVVMAVGFGMRDTIRLGGESFAYGYPLVIMDITRQNFTATLDAANTLHHVREFPDSSFRNIVRPNVDTLYSVAWIDLAEGPRMFEVPSTDRYYVMQFLDGWTNVFASIGPRTTGTAAGTFLIAGPDWNGPAPPAATVLRSRNYRDQVAKGLLTPPKDGNYVVELIQVDGSMFPQTGKITFVDPSFNPQTGTFLIRVTIPNPDGTLRPNQYVRVRLSGATRSNEITVPQRAVQQGAKGHFVWVVNPAGKAELRPVQVGEWYRDSWFISEGLAAGDQVVADGPLRLAADSTVKMTPYVPKPGALEAAQETRPIGATVSVHFAAGKAELDAEAIRLIKELVPPMQAGVNPIDVTGFADRTGNRSANLEIAKRRATAVREALLAEGLPADRVRLQAPREVTGSGSDRDARRVEIAAGK